MSSSSGSGNAHSNSSHQFDVPLVFVAEAAIHDGRAKQTKIAYGRAVNEWMGYCDHINHHIDRDRNDTFRSQLVTSEKLTNFLFYQAFRAKQKVGGIIGGRRGFNHDEYEKLKLDYQEHFQKWQGDESYRMPDPEGGGISISAMMQIRAALKELHAKQKQQDCTLVSWDSVWGYHAKCLFQLVENRKARMDRESCREKTNNEFAGYHAIDRFEDIEREFWMGSLKPEMKSAFPYMRFRMLFLYTTSGILRCESLMKAELSDFQGLKLKKDTDIDPIYVMITQIAEGTFALVVKMASLLKKNLHNDFSNLQVKLIMVKFSLEEPPGTVMFVCALLVQCPCT